MHIILFLLIAALFIEQLGQNFIYEKFDFLIDIIGNFYGAIFYLTGFAAILISIFIIYKSIKSKTFKPKLWDYCFILLLFWGLISVILSENKELAVFGGHRMDGYISYLIYATCYIGVRTLKNEKTRLWIIRFFTIIASVLCMDFICNDNITSIFYNKNHFGYLLTLSSMLLCGLFILEKKLYIKSIYLILFGINAYTLISVDTFGCYLAVLFGLIFSIIFIAISKKEKKTILSAAIILVFFIVISIGLDFYTQITHNNFNKLSNDIKQLTTDASSTENVGSLRIELWKHAFQYIKERPIFGYGPEGTYNYYWHAKHDVGYDRPHNEYIQCALFMGIPGAVFYITGLISIFIYCIKNRKQLPAYAIISGIAVFAYCISAFFGNTMFYTTPYFFMMLGMVSNPLLEKK